MEERLGETKSQRHQEGEERETDKITFFFSITLKMGYLAAKELLNK